MRINVSSPAAFTRADMNSLLNSDDAYWETWDLDHVPTFKVTEQSGITTYELRWPRRVEFADGRQVDLVIHVHEDHVEASLLNGGGAWLEAQGLSMPKDHDVNVGQTRVMRNCVGWVNEHYVRGFQYKR